MAITTEMTTDRDDILALCERLSREHRKKDADAIAACYADDTVIYDMAPSSDAAATM